MGFILLSSCHESFFEKKKQKKKEKLKKIKEKS